MGISETIIGPKVPPEEIQKHWQRYARPKALFVGAAVLLVVSIFFPYWVLRLQAPQYGEQVLQVKAYVNRLEGERMGEGQGNTLAEIEELNHYVGMPSFESGALLERSVAVIALVALACLLLAALLLRSRFVVLLTLPALLFPLIFLGDLQFWLWRYGHSLDPSAPLAGAVGNFTPPVLGPAEIANFSTMALPGPGLVMATVASIVIGVGLWYHRKAYKPLLDTAAEGDTSGDQEPPENAPAADGTAKGTEEAPETETAGTT